MRQIKSGLTAFFEQQIQTIQEGYKDSSLADAFPTTSESTVFSGEEARPSLGISLIEDIPAIDSPYVAAAKPYEPSENVQKPAGPPS